MINVWDYQDIDDEVRIDLTGNCYIIGKIVSIDDEEDSGLGEDGISIITPDGGYVGLAQSEIVKITRLGGTEI